MVRKDLLARSSYGAALVREWLTQWWWTGTGIWGGVAHLGSRSPIDQNSSGILFHVARIVFLNFFRYDKMDLICPEPISPPNA